MWNVLALRRSGNRTVLETVSLDHCIKGWSCWILKHSVQHDHLSRIVVSETVSSRTETETATQSTPPGVTCSYVTTPRHSRRPPTWRLVNHRWRCILFSRFVCHRTIPKLRHWQAAFVSQFQTIQPTYVVAENWLFERRLKRCKQKKKLRRRSLLWL